MEILCLLRELVLLGVHLEFAWIPAHVGISDNERADAIAKDDVCSHPIHCALLSDVKV